MDSISHIFPYHLFHRGDRIIVYDKKIENEEIYCQVEKNKYIEILYTIRDESDLVKLKQWNYDAVLLVTSDYEEAKIEKDKMISFGISPEIIKWEKIPYLISDFFRYIFYPSLRIMESVEENMEIENPLESYHDSTVAYEIEIL